VVAEELVAMVVVAEASVDWAEPGEPGAEVKVLPAQAPLAARGELAVVVEAPGTLVAAKAVAEAQHLVLFVVP